jgi:hypothetical protein
MLITQPSKLKKAAMEASCFAARSGKEKREESIRKLFF